MKINQLRDELDKLNIPKDAYTLTGGLPNESFCLNTNNDEWEVYYSERGNKTGLKAFNDESLACEYFLNWMKSVFKK